MEESRAKHFDSSSEQFDYRGLLSYHRKQTLRFSEFVQRFLDNPQQYLHTSSSLIAAAIKYFGFEITIRSGEPVISYNIFRDPFNAGMNAVFGQEFCIKQILDIIESADKEVGPNRGIILVGPPASGKTNIVDLIVKALEEFTKQEQIRIHSFFFRFQNEQKRCVEIHSAFQQHPLLLFPSLLKLENGLLTRPRQQLFEHANRLRPEKSKVSIPPYYLTASLDKRTLDILESLLNNPQNRGKTLFELIEEYIRVEEIEFSAAQAKGICNIDEMANLKVGTRPFDLTREDMALISEHIPGKTLYNYEGAIVGSNRGILHIHDAFGVNGERVQESDYKPLLMLLGSGRVSVESTQTSVDTNVILTTNIEEMELLDRQLTSSKLLDRIEKVPVNYLLSASAEMDILRRDLEHIREKYEIDPNLLRIASYYSVMTRLLPPLRRKFEQSWNQSKIDFYQSITPEQKLLIYSSLNEDPVATIEKLPHWHPFRNEAMRIGLDLSNPKSFSSFIAQHPEAISLRDSPLFDESDLKLIDDEFMRCLWNEHYPNEGRHGISIRQLQNVMRNTVANSDGRKVHVGIFLSQLKRTIAEGPELHHWLEIDSKYVRKRRPIRERWIGDYEMDEGEGDYGDFQGLVTVVKAMYYAILRHEISVCTVNRDPRQIEQDLRRYLQHALLARATDNKAFAHVMVPRYAFIDPGSGEKVEEPDLNFLESMEQILADEYEVEAFRKEISQKFLDLQASGDLKIESGKSVITSADDNFLKCFSKEYGQLLSHRKMDKEINPEILRNLFFYKLNDPVLFANAPEDLRGFAEGILENMCQRFHYTPALALSTLVYALRKEVVDFREMLG